MCERVIHDCRWLNEELLDLGVQWSRGTFMHGLLGMYSDMAMSLQTV